MRELIPLNNLKAESKLFFLLPYKLKRETGFEPATSTLARLRSSQLSYSRIVNAHRRNFRHLANTNAIPFRRWVTYKRGVSYFNAMCCNISVLSLLVLLARTALNKTCKALVLGGRGFEPPRVAPIAPKAIASANFAIRPDIFLSSFPITKFENLLSLPRLERGTTTLKVWCST
jgi:hypothetical protein